jgi:hypothetical protein
MYSQFDEIGPGTRTKEFVFTPDEYLRYGDRAIVSMPLINTSLRGLAVSGWYLSVHARYVASYGHTKLKYHFSDPDEKGNPYLVFKLWAKDNLVLAEKVNPYTLIKTLVDRDLTPNFSRQASFSVPPAETQQIPKEVPVGLPITLENEFEILQTLNEQRREQLKRIKRRTGNETSGSDFNALSLSA